MITKLTEQSSLTRLKGIGEKSAEKFASAGIHSLGELIRYYPRAYEAYEAPSQPSAWKDAEIAVAQGSLIAAPTVKQAGKTKIVNAKFAVNRVVVSSTWFNLPYLRSSLVPGMTYILRGKVKMHNDHPTLSHPQVFTPVEYEKFSGRMKAIYPLREALTDGMVSKAIRQALDSLPAMTDFLPEEIRLEQHLTDEWTAICQIHFPDSEDSLRQARRRLVFDEFLLFILGIRQSKSERDKTRHSYHIERGTVAEELIGQLPYTLTYAQRRVWHQIQDDLVKERVMTRLVQGDVGSGKTILAFLAMITVAESGGQSALMAPTGVLAHQHFEAWEKLRETYHLPYEAVLLTGDMKSAHRKDVYQRIETGKAQIIIGTHALFQEKVKYSSLMLVITDEQHRFGVRQRQALGYKGELPHTLVMSATPIPRTLAVILYGDLDISQVDERPANRLKIKTAVVDTLYRPKAYRFITSQIREGHQAYVICPLVEASEAEGMEDMENVVEYTEKLRAQLPQDIRIAMLHGRMKQREKDEIMARFSSGQIQVLVATTVIEVGVNVPNATVMMVEDAQRFGLAQLHQLRGRVGRGEAQSYCILVYPSHRSNEQENGQAPKRLMVLKESDNGFDLAQKDLEMRGPGDLFGIRQSGELAFQLADIYTDASILACASEVASVILREDSDLSLLKYSNLKQNLTEMLKNTENNLNI